MIKRKLDNKFSEMSKLTKSFEKARDNLSNNCLEAANIPEWKDKFLRKGKYEMSESDGNRLKHILEKLNDKQLSDILKIYNSQIDRLKEYKELDKNYNSIFEETIRMLDNYNNFTTLYKPLKQTK